MNKQHLYHPEALNDWNYFKDNQSEIDDFQFANVSAFDNLKSDNSFYSVRENTLKQSEKEGNDSQDLKQDIMVFDNLKSELLDSPEKEPLETILIAQRSHANQDKLKLIKCSILVRLSMVLPQF